MAKFSMKKGGKEVGPASTYAAPHTMDGKSMTTAKNAVAKSGNNVDAIKMSLGSQVFKSQNDAVKTDGVKQRGSGAATKGYTSRGPMA
jgi:hypothetical protein